MESTKNVPETTKSKGKSLYFSEPYSMETLESEEVLEEEDLTNFLQYDEFLKSFLS